MGQNELLCISNSIIIATWSNIFVIVIMIIAKRDKVSAVGEVLAAI